MPHDHYALVVCEDCGRTRALAGRGLCRSCYTRWHRRHRPQRPKAVKLCLHCGAKRANRPRQLCWGCYYAPGIADNYRPAQFDPVDRDDFSGGHGPPPAPTVALPGSPQKVAVLAERVTLRCRLWHERDAVWAD